MTGDVTAGGVTAAGGFSASGVAAGLKASGALDVDLVVNIGPEFSAAAVGEPVAADLSTAEVRVEIDLAAGRADGWVWTNDLTAAYVHENSA